MLLSIVMIVKNEEKYLEKTLKSLLPLMKDVNSELVILDTGSSDNTVNIATKYSEKVYFEKWNDNFADMRNKSISYASGDWILILDADEELIDYENLVDFFKAQLYKKYNSASIELKNIVSEDADKYNKLLALRLFKNEESFKYEGAIHEQPVYKKPIYNNVAKFNHYGYMFEDEEVRQKKLKRNEELLIKEMNFNDKNPYIYYQLSKNYFAYGKLEDSLYYIEKSDKIYKQLGLNPIYVQSDLAKIYLAMKKNERCELICAKYIKLDDKNIDIYYYLALSQKNLGKYEKSLENYKKYLALLENYEISTQNNDIFCNADTVGQKDEVEISMVKLYYYLEMYKNVINISKKLKKEQLKKIYVTLFMSLSKLNREDEILNIYNENISSLVEKKGLEIDLENTLLNAKDLDKRRIYKVLSNIDNNYGILNKVRYGKKLSCKEYNDIIIIEKESYYSDLIYYSFKSGIDLNIMLTGINILYLQKFFNHMIICKRDCIVDMYEYLLSQKNTLDLDLLKIYSSLSKALFMYGNLKGEKYEKIFLMYITYNYDYLRHIYNEKINDQSLLELVRSEDEIFVIHIIMLQKIKVYNKIEYIRSLKLLVINNPEYKMAIEILIKNFKMEFEEDEESKNLKDKYKSIIKNEINKGNILEAKSETCKYEDIFGFESENLNLRAVIEIFESNFEEADKLLKEAYILDRTNYDAIFNIACVKEILGEYKEAIEFLNYIASNCYDKNIVLESEEKIKFIKTIYKD